IFLCIKKTERINNEYNSRVKEIVDVDLDLKSKSVFKNIRVKKIYKKTISRIKPDLIISYAIKPNIYCGLYAKLIPMIANITGLGTLFNKDGILKRIGIFLYKKSFKNVDYIFFQNESSYDVFARNKIRIKKYKIIPGSGVNTSRFLPKQLKRQDGIVNYLFASRASIKEKGFGLLVQAMPSVIKENSNVHFNFLIDENEINKKSLEWKIINECKQFITILPRNNDMTSIYSQNDFLVSPSYYNEGISNVLLESLSCCRPIITTNDNAGCREVLLEGKNGFGIKSKDLNSLIETIIKSSKLTVDEVLKMGEFGRQFVIKKYERKIVINEYFQTINEIQKQLEEKKHGKIKTFFD
ncbi:MAG: glycosyltransferase, partial [Bacilli bacterium]|nr:glycosyltransferase [Bacilli bacterium]